MKRTQLFWKFWYGIGYGGLVAYAYFFVKNHSHDGGVALFGAFSAAIFLLHLLIWPRLTLSGIVDRKMLFRGLLYGVTQLLILKAQGNGFTSTAMVASTMGSVFGVVLGRLVLREKIRGLGLIAVLLCFTAVFLNPLLILRSYWGLLGGLTQGSGFVLARSLMLDQKSIRSSISTGFFVSMLLTLLVLGVKGTTAAISSVHVHDLAIVLPIVLVIQYGFFQLYKLLDSQRASLLLLSRLPWAVGLEHWIMGSVLVPVQLLSSLLIAAGAVFLLFDSRVALEKPVKALAR